MWPLGTLDGWLDGHPSRHVGNSHPTVLLFCNSYRNWSLWLWCILFHWVSAIMTLTNSWHFVIVAMMFLKIHMLQVTQVKRNIQDIRTIFTPLFLARLRELFGARHSSKSLTMTSLKLLFVCCMFLPITCVVKRILCKRYLKFADYMASGIYAHRWVWSPGSMHQNISDCRKQADAIWRRRKISERCWRFMAIACRVRECESLCTKKDWRSPPGNTSLHPEVHE